MNYSDTSIILVIIVIVVVLFFAFSRCKIKCGCSSEERYYSLPFAGGAIRTYGPNKPRIESGLWKSMDQTDEGVGNMYPL